MTMVFLERPSFVELVEELADLRVMFGEPVAVDVLDAGARDAAVFLLDMDEHVLARGVVPQEERLAVLGAAIEEIQRIGEDFVVERLHPLGGQRAFVLRRAVGRAGNDAARIELLAELGIGRPVRVFEVLVGVEVIEAAEDTRRSRAGAADAPRGRPDGSCRTARSRSPWSSGLRRA